jgi:arsenate reductase
VAEFIGTAVFLIAVIGSGVAAQNLSAGDTGLELLENAAATGAALVAIIMAVGSVSGAHLNPVVSCADALFRGLSRVQTVVYVAAQVVGAAIGVIIANLMFALPAVTISSHVRSSPNLWLGEIVATFGLLLVVFGLTRTGRGAAAPFAVGAYITGAYFFTSSTSPANPTNVTALGRAVPGATEATAGSSSQHRDRLRIRLPSLLFATMDGYGRCLIAADRAAHATPPRVGGYGCESRVSAPTILNGSPVGGLAQEQVRVPE